MDILFSEEDDRGVKQPHDDPLVIMFMIEGFYVGGVKGRAKDRGQLSPTLANKFMLYMLIIYLSFNLFRI